MLERLEAETVVIGAGVVGLAVARQLARSGRDVLVLEAAEVFGAGISSRNSEVVHGGLYYPTGSFKARLCVEGRKALYEYCRSHGVPHRRCGKWVVAVDQVQQASLAAIAEQASCNGVRLNNLTRQQLQSEPQLAAIAGLESPETGIVDSHQLMLALIGDLEDAGGRVAYRAPVTSAEAGTGGQRLRVGGKMACELACREVINAAGLQAHALAQAWEGYPKARLPALHLARGHYFSYQGAHPFSRLIYPVPEPGGLGIHLTLDMAGQARFGPDVQWIHSLDYRIPAERLGHFAAAIKRWWPEVDPQRLQPAYAGIRPKLSGPGEPAADFFIEGPEEHGLAGLVLLLGIESPGLTSCLAIAELVQQKLDQANL